MPQLVLMREGRALLCFPLTGASCRIGRHPDNDISLPDPEISRFHAQLISEGSTYRLQNQGRGGVWIKGQLVGETPLADGDTFCLGPWEVRFELEDGWEERETVIARPAPSEGIDSFCGMIGTSPVMEALFDRISRVAAFDLAVLICGETGTGKELVARALHQLSGSRGSFMALNCGAISPQLIESELFGHERGAFTGAAYQHAGAFEQAAAGTLFLDEVGELPCALQPKLLRVLESKTYRRVGGSQELTARTRIVAATHRNLRHEVKAGRFREDLYYRLEGMELVVPPLRERYEDMALLAKHFLLQSTPADRGPFRLLPGALAQLKSYEWPGNIRELRNVIMRSVLLSEEDLLTEHNLQMPRPVGLESASLQGAERDVIVAKLREVRGNKSQAATELGIAKSTLFRKLKDYGLA